MWVRGAYKIRKQVVTGSQQQAAVEKKGWCFWNEYTIQNEYQLADIPRILLKRVGSSTVVTELPGGTVYCKYGCSTVYKFEPSKPKLHLRNMKSPPLISWSRRNEKAHSPLVCHSSISSCRTPLILRNESVLHHWHVTTACLLSWLLRSRGLGFLNSKEPGTLYKQRIKIHAKLQLK